MRFIFLILTSIVAVSALANESRFVVNKNEGEADIQMKYRRLHSNFDNGNAFTNFIGLDYNRALPQFADMKIGLGFAQQDTDAILVNSNTATRSTSLGFTDITGALRVAEVEEEFTWYYGGAASISPGAARDSRFAASTELRRDAGNNLSGYQTIAGVIGVESYVDKLALGSELELRAYSRRSVASGYSSEEALSRNDDQRFVPTLTGFVEFPVVRDLTIGFNAALMRPDPKLEQLVLGGPDNYLSGKLYSELKVDKETAATLELGSTSQVIPHRESQTEVSLGIRKAL